MRNVLDKNFRENHCSHFVFNKVFPKIAPFIRSHKWCQNMTHMLWMLDKQIYRYACECTWRPISLAPTRTHVHARTHKQIYNTDCFPRKQWLCESSSVLSCTCSDHTSSPFQHAVDYLNEFCLSLSLLEPRTFWKSKFNCAVAYAWVAAQ
jgi:hypothetical protein